MKLHWNDFRYNVHVLLDFTRFYFFYTFFWCLQTINYLLTYTSEQPDVSDLLVIEMKVLVNLN